MAKKQVMPTNCIGEGGLQVSQKNKIPKILFMEVVMVPNNKYDNLRINKCR